MKKRITAICILCMLAVSAGCTGKTKDPASATPSAAATAETTKKPADATAETTEKPADATAETTEKPADVTVAPTEKPADPTAAPTKKPAPGETVLYQLNDPGNNSQMMSYVIYTKEGKLIIIDGGYDRNIGQLISLAKELTGQAKPVVDAWLFTHCHSDHTNAFSALMKNQPDALQVSRIYYNFPTGEFIQKYESDSYDTFSKFSAAIKKLTTDQCKVVQVGDQIQVGSVSFEVLLTPDETVTANAMNESSVVYRANIEGQKVLFLGDLGPYSTTRFYKACKDKLACDVVQMAHHGSNGIARQLYSNMKPKACLWPTPDWLWNNDNGGGPGSGPWETVELYQYMVKMGVTKHYVAKDGVLRIAFPIK